VELRPPYSERRENTADTEGNQISTRRMKNPTVPREFRKIFHDNEDDDEHDRKK
jgi:hypothetical protein